MSEDKKIPDLFDIKMDFSLFTAIKYNRSLKEYKHEYDTKEFVNFKRLFKSFVEKLENQDPSAFSDLSALMSMWGYHRKYCGMCGRPVIGKIYRLQGGKIVCQTCHGSFRITEKLFEKDIDDDSVQKTQQQDEKHIESLVKLNSEKWDIDVTNRINI